MRIATDSAKSAESKESLRKNWPEQLMIKNLLRSSNVSKGLQKKLKELDKKRKLV